MAFSKTCVVCSENVRYTAGRRRCYKCRGWFHSHCGIDTGNSLDNLRPLCKVCLRKDPKLPLRRVARDMNGGHEDFPALEAILWSAIFNQDEAEISEKLGHPPEKVREWGERLRKAGVWRDGSLHVESDEGTQDYANTSVTLILYALVADGMVERSVGPAGTPVSEAGGTERDGKQEIDQGDPGSDSSA